MTSLRAENDFSLVPSPCGASVPERRNWQGARDYLDHLRDVLGGILNPVTATATAKWVTGSPPTVAMDRDDTSESISVKLIANGHKGDPNVQNNDQLDVAQKANGDWFALWPGNFMDDKIGTQKLWNSTKTIPAGWQVADGTNGTQNMVGGGEFLLAHSTTSGTTAAAAATGSTEASGTTGSGTASGTTGSGTASGTTGSGTASGTTGSSSATT